MSFQVIILLGNLLGLLFIPVVLRRKRHPVSAMAWVLTVVFIPYLGVFFFLVLGASSIKRQLRRKIFHRSRFLRFWMSDEYIKTGICGDQWEGMDRYALKVGGASPPTNGNRVKVYGDGKVAFDEKFKAIREAVHHVHLEYFILQNDEAGRSLIELLCEKAKQGVQVRLLLDAVGSYYATALVKKLIKAGGKAAFFLPSRILMGRFGIGLRNHRKILVCDGKVAFMGGMNVGNEYLSKVKRFGYWRDTHLKLNGPIVLAIQRIFAEDWDFAAGELLSGDHFFPMPSIDGSCCLQMIWSGPDQDNNAARETYFAAITAARSRLWISTPYLIPDGAMLAALKSAALRGVDVRVLTQGDPPDYPIPYLASRYFWEELMECGVKIYTYGKGMMHAKVMLADGKWGAVGSANLDIRSLRLNFEVVCHIYTPKVIAELEMMFEDDLKGSREVILSKFRARRRGITMAENICRLFSPLL